MAEIEDSKELTIPRIGPAEVAVLEEIQGFLDKLETALHPEERLQCLEQAAYAAARAANTFYGRFIQCMMIVKQEGLWRVPKENGVQKYARYDDYFMDVHQNVRKISRRSVATRISQANILMFELGMDADAVGELLEDKPSLTGELLQTADIATYSGKFLGFDEETRARVAAELGYEKDIPDDKTLMRESLERLREADHDEGSKLVNTLNRKIRIWVAYNAEKDTLSVQANFIDERGKRVQVVRDYVPKKEQNFPKKLRDFLLTRVRQDHRKR